MRVKFYFGDYVYRQSKASEDGVNFYVEHHFGSDLKGIGNTCLVLIPEDNPYADLCKSFAYEYVRLVEERLKIPPHNDTGVMRIKSTDRGGSSICRVEAPAALVEPLYISNLRHCKKLMNGGIQALAEILAECLKTTLCKVEDPLIGFSVGHKYKRSAPYDRGAHMWGKPEFSEADLSEMILWEAKRLLLEE